MIDLNDEQLLRYSRHILLPEIGIDGQQKLLASHALVVGAGGLGSPISLYLAASGVGRITLCDHDTVDLTNLQRQIVHNTDSIGQPKVASAREALARINPEVAVDVVQERVEGARLEALVSDADVVIDATDNFATRHAINRACVKFHKPLVSGAGVRFDGQVAVPRGGWVAARASGPASKYLGDDYAFAQTSPVYVVRGGKRYLNAADVQFLSETMDAIWARVERSRWRSDAERDAFRAAVDRGRAFYQRLMSEATPAPGS